MTLCVSHVPHRHVGRTLLAPVLTVFDRGLHRAGVAVRGARQALLTLLFCGDLNETDF